MGKNIFTGRRSFLKKSVAGAAGLALTSRADSIFPATSAAIAPGPGNKWPGRVVVNFNKAAVTASGADTAVIEQMVNDAIQKLTGQTTIGAAWKAVFPTTLTATSKIAIKTNTANTGLPAPHLSSVRAITDGLQLMDFNGTKFAAANITLYDMNAANLSSAKFTAANFPGINLVDDTAVNGGDGAVGNRTYAQSLKNAAFLINVFSPRGHTLPQLPTGSKFTLGFKSHFGTYSNPSGLHANAPQNIRDINCTGPVFNKNVLSVCSGIYGMNEGNGPGGSADNYTTYAQSIDKTSTNQCPTTIIMSTDPVSAEMQTVKMIRINKNGAYTAADMPTYLQASAGMTASGFTATNNIGIIDESQMTVMKIINGASTPVLNPAHGSLNSFGAAIVARHIKGHHSAFIEFKLPLDRVGSEASIEIFDDRGALARKFSQKVLGVQNHFSWDEKDERGARVSKGTYIVHLVSRGKNASALCTITG
jgi:uncharacterized protein YjbI with pentapeptide repeats